MSFFGLHIAGSALAAPPAGWIATDIGTLGGSSSHATAVNNAAAYLNPDVSAFPGHLSDYAPAGATESPITASPSAGSAGATE